MRRTHLVLGAVDWSEVEERLESLAGRSRRVIAHAERSQEREVARSFREREQTRGATHTYAPVHEVLLCEMRRGGRVDQLQQRVNEHQHTNRSKANSCGAFKFASPTQRERGGQVASGGIP